MADLPEPLTPAECDLRGLPFMPMDVARVLDSDLFALSTGEEFKAALALWCKSWLQVPAASLPDDDRVLAHLSASGTRWKKLKDMALRGWVKCSDGRYYHPVVAEKALEAWKHRLAQRERANKRWGNTETPSSGNAMVHADAHATASPTAMQGTGTGTVKGESPKPTITHQIEKPTPTRATDCFNEVCSAADWHPRTDDQRAEALGVVNGWLAEGFSIDVILAGIGLARSRKPSERTRTIKRFTTTIRGMHCDRQGQGMNGSHDPIVEHQTRQLVGSVGASLRVGQ